MEAKLAERDALEAKAAEREALEAKAAEREAASQTATGEAEGQDQEAEDLEDLEGQEAEDRHRRPFHKASSHSHKARQTQGLHHPRIWHL